MTTPYTKKVKLLGASEFLAKSVLTKVPEILCVVVLAYKECMVWDREEVWHDTDNVDSPWPENRNSDDILAKGGIIISFNTADDYICFDVELIGTGYHIEKEGRLNDETPKGRHLVRPLWKFVREWAAKNF